MRIKLFEDFIHTTPDGKELRYDSEWKMPGNPIREKLEEDLRFILIDLEDLGYRPQIGGFIKNRSHKEGEKYFPYVWIANNKSGRAPIDWEEVNPTINKLKSYLEHEGFETYSRVINKDRRLEQIYIHFNLKKDKE